MKEEQCVNPLKWGKRVFLILRVINPKLKTNMYCTGTLYIVKYTVWTDSCN